MTGGSGPEAGSVSDAIRVPLRLRDELRRELRTGLEQLYGDRLKGLFVYGSYARGEADGDSDVDVLIVLDRVERYGQELDRTSYAISELSLKYDLCLSRVFLSEQDWLHGDRAFVLNARAEAIQA